MVMVTLKIVTLKNCLETEGI